jgi:serine/threonine-protein kinase
VIGQGAGSTIYVVSHSDTKQLYALKHVVRKTEKDDRFIEQLEGEYEVGKNCNHPGLRKSIEIKYNRSLLRKVQDAALIMELVDGQSLETHAPKRITQMVEVFVQVAQALEALHHTGYVHCDLKPNNILINAAGQVKVIDLGQTCKNGTIKKRIQGTPDYISPEQVKCEAVTLRTDTYNLGATMYWLLTGKNVPTLYTLKRGDNSFLIDSAVPAPKDLNPKVPENLSNLVMECVKINPAKRPEMVDVARRLDTILYTLQKASGMQQHQQQPAAALRTAGQMAAV